MSSDIEYDGMSTATIVDRHHLLQLSIIKNLLLTARIH
jgi:hypothetical protein